MLAGLLLTTLTLLLLAGVRAIRPRTLVDLAALLQQGTLYLASHLALVGVSVLAHLLMALLLAVAANDLLAATAGQRIVSETCWYSVFTRAAAAGLDVFLSVQLNDGTVVMGYRAEYSTEPDPSKRELALAQPITIRNPIGAAATPLADAWQRLVLPGSAIANIAVAYVGRPVKPPRRTLLGRIRSLIRAHAWQAALIGVAVLLGMLLLIGPTSPPGSRS